MTTGQRRTRRAANHSGAPQAGGAERGAPWERPEFFADIAALLADGLPDPPAPSICRRTDDHGLFYVGQVNSLFGDAEVAKTLLALAACVEAMHDGHRVLVVDLDHNGLKEMVQRLLALGADPAILADRNRFRYVEPADRDELEAVVKIAKQGRPAVVVVDSMGELLPMLGLSSNSPDDFTVAHAKVLKPLARCGAAVIVIDHVAKGSESRAYGATGTAAKRRAVGGVSLRMAVREPFVPGHGGKATLTVNKDRHGGLRRNCPTGTSEREPLAGTFVLTDHEDGSLSWEVTAPEDGERATRGGTTEDVAELAALDPPPESARNVKDRMHWSSGRATAALRAWRSSVPHPGGEERGTDPKPRRLAKRSSVPHPGDEERGTRSDQRIHVCAPKPAERTGDKSNELPKKKRVIRRMASKEVPRKRVSKLRAVPNLPGDTKAEDYAAEQRRKWAETLELIGPRPSTPAVKSRAEEILSDVGRPY